MDGEQQAVRDFNVYPLQFANHALQQKLGRRGETFWKCRFRRLMSYSEDASGDRLGTMGERSMIDMKTYQKIHAPNTSLASATADSNMREEEMAGDDPPDGQFKYVVPLSVKGFNLRRKKWLDLKVDQISDVQWNKTAFTPTGSVKVKSSAGVTKAHAVFATVLQALNASPVERLVIVCCLRGDHYGDHP